VNPLSASLHYGGLKKAIRLCKNVKNDAIDEGKKIAFPSFDIAATMYHADLSALQRCRYYEMAVLAETQRFLDYLYHNPGEAKALYVPDGSRRIFDTDEKYEGLKTLSIEMDDLAREVAKEQSSVLRTMDSVPLYESRETLRNAMIL
jgi:dipeptidyl aminopeptidase/acylaminoacyl peptidase